MSTTPWSTMMDNVHRGHCDTTHKVPRYISLTHYWSNVFFSYINRSYYFTVLYISIFFVYFVLPSRRLTTFAVAMLTIPGLSG
jgi:hypothetical protein